MIAPDKGRAALATGRPSSTHARRKERTMLGLNLLGNAVRHLAESLNALSRTVAEVNTGLRQRLALDRAEAEGPPALPGPADPEDLAEPAGAGRRNGRKARAD